MDLISVLLHTTIFNDAKPERRLSRRRNLLYLRVGFRSGTKKEIVNESQGIVCPKK